MLNATSLLSFGPVGGTVDSSLYVSTSNSLAPQLGCWAFKTAIPTVPGALKALYDDSLETTAGASLERTWLLGARQ
jgi:hypothetical protein